MSSRAYAPRVQQAAVFAGAGRRPISITGLGLQGWGPFTAAAAVAAIVSLAFIAWTVNRWVSDDATIALDDFGEAVAALT